ncbi:MAG: hypothetical protein RIR00_844 [Pseudomonadota bacterium]
MRRLIPLFQLLLLCLCAGVLPAAAQEFLDPAQAFKASVRAVDARTLEVEMQIAKGYYLYRDKFRFSAEGQTLGSPVFPKGKEKEDENFGKVEVYYGGAKIRLPLERNQSGPLQFKLKVTSQGCADAGVCYPPFSQTVNASLPAEPAAAATPAAGTASPSAAPAPAAADDESGALAASLHQAGFWANLALFFVAGIGLAFTPCVLPMLPILSGIIVGQGHQVSRGRGFALSLAYVLGMALTYTLAGVAAALTGTLLASALQNPWVLGSFALLFVLLSGSMFGFYELQLPSGLQSKLSEEAGHLQGGRGIGVFLMGALSALIVGPCVAAPLAGALLYISQSGDVLLGGAALFALALGMGVPLLAVGLSAGSLLPKTGPWMEGVKKAFGVLLLATALWLLAPVLPAWLQMLGWALLLILPAIYLHALDPLPPQARGWPRFWKGIGVVMLLSGAAMLIGLFAGSRDPWQPLSGLRGAQAANASGATPAPHASFQRVTSLADLERRLQQPGKPVLLDFYADWCVSCKEMERFTFADPAVQARLQDFLLLQADVTANSPEDKALLQRFQLFGPPGIIFFDRQGRELPTPRLVGFKDAAAFLQLLAQVK